MGMILTIWEGYCEQWTRNNEGPCYASDIQFMAHKCLVSEWMNEEKSAIKDIEVKYQESRREGDRAAWIGGNKNLGGLFEKVNIWKQNRFQKGQWD